MPTQIQVRDHSTGRVEFEVMGLTPFAEVMTESPFYVPSPGSFLSARAWVDEDGKHAIVAHDCRDGRDVHILRWPTWQVVEGSVYPQEVSPSFDCAECGLHTFLPINATEEPQP